MWTFKHTPLSPEYSVDWSAISKEYQWIRDMSGVQQNPVWHAEGDVYIHTRMVAEALAANQSWRFLLEGSRHALFASALLHDVAKPKCTQLVNDVWSSPNHSKVGEQMARMLLWQTVLGQVDFRTREKICKLVRYHGLPLRFIDKEDPQKAVIQASQEVNLYQLAILARADVEGREAKDQKKLLETIDYFIDFANENNCLYEPYKFETNHHRFMYCVGQKPLYYVPYDDTWGEVVIMCGIPASGKSHVADKIALEKECPIISTDATRARMGVPPEDEQGPVIDAVEQEALTLLRAHKPFVYDATNVYRDIRSSMVAMFAKYGARVHIKYVESPSWQDVFTRNKQRERHVPDSVIIHMAEKLDMPSLNEAHEVNFIVSE